MEITQDGFNRIVKLSKLVLTFLTWIKNFLGKVHNFN